MDATQILKIAREFGYTISSDSTPLTVVFVHRSHGTFFSKEIQRITHSFQSTNLDFKSTDLFRDFLLKHHQLSLFP